jgi:hypothetical protein
VGERLRKGRTPRWVGTIVERVAAEAVGEVDLPDGEERCTQIELVSADMAAWISGPIVERLYRAYLLKEQIRQIYQLHPRKRQEILKKLHFVVSARARSGTRTAGPA